MIFRRTVRKKNTELKDSEVTSILIRKFALHIVGEKSEREQGNKGGDGVKKNTIK